MNTTNKGQRNLRLPRPPWEKFLPYTFFIFMGYASADLIIIGVREYMLPSQTPPPKGRAVTLNVQPDFGSYNSILNRNIFSSAGVIPDPVKSKDGGKGKEEIPVPSQLPLSLVGTLVHSNPEKSIAAIEVKGKNQILSYTIKKEIDGIAIIEKIERQRVFIRNLNTNKLEFIEIKIDNKISFGTTAANSSGSGTGDVKAIGENKFEMKRNDLLKYVSDLPSVLMQAQTAPARRPTGEIYGFKVLGMQQGSIFSELGLKPMDVIMGVNGSPVTSPQQAMELYQALRNSSKVKLQLERDGRTINMDYNITN